MRARCCAGAQWSPGIDTGADGRFNVLEVETRYLKGPPPLDPAGMPTQVDNESIVEERFFFDKDNPALLHDEITLEDRAFTRPWTVLKTYRRLPNQFPDWPEDNCSSHNELIKIGAESYYRSGDGNPMPTRINQSISNCTFFLTSRV
jgi:hypothetical protein